MSISLSEFGKTNDVKGTWKVTEYDLSLYIRYPEINNDRQSIDFVLLFNMQLSTTVINLEYDGGILFRKELTLTITIRNESIKPKTDVDSDPEQESAEDKSEKESTEDKPEKNTGEETNDSDESYSFQAQDSSYKTGIIIGVFVGALVVVIRAIVSIVFIVKKRRESFSVVIGSDDEASL